MKSELSPVSRYTLTAIRLHWLIALGIVATFGLGLYMSDLPLSPDKLKYYSWHKWAGVGIFFLVLVRLAWRIKHSPPAMPATMPHWQQQVAGGVHHLLYALMVIVPLSGWLMSSAKGYQTVWFGVLPLPDLVNKNKELGDVLREVHEVLNFLMAGLVLAHAAAAVKHHLVDRDDVLARMLPFLARKTSKGE